MYVFEFILQKNIDGVCHSFGFKKVVNDASLFFCIIWEIILMVMYEKKKIHSLKT